MIVVTLIKLLSLCLWLTNTVKHWNCSNSNKNPNSHVPLITTVWSGMRIEQWKRGFSAWIFPKYIQIENEKPRLLIIWQHCIEL
jgi:hypothetical protein